LEVHEFRDIRMHEYVVAPADAALSETVRLDKANHVCKAHVGHVAPLKSLEQPAPAHGCTMAAMQDCLSRVTHIRRDLVSSRPPRWDR
jgi:hypothetical protein